MSEVTEQTCAFDKLLKRNVPHILETIFFSLDYNSLRSCSEVCKRWKDLMASESYQDKLVEIKCREETALMMACKKGAAKRVKALLLLGVDPNIRRQDEEYTSPISPIFVAVERSHKHVVKLLLSAGANPNEAYKDITSLYWSVGNNDIGIVRLLLGAGADANISSRDLERKRTPLHRSATCNVKVVKMLLDKGADPNATNERGETPYYLASYWGRKDVVKLLLEAGADESIRPNSY